jgi:hypothetical protein
MDGATAVAEAPQVAATAPAQAGADAQAQTPAAAPELNPEQQAYQQAQEAQLALMKVRKDKEDACAADVQQVLAKHGCELIVGHNVKVSLRQS